ncbi:MAG: hypothetical protein LBF91_01090 [Azoarcus sp.]|nr:hypothetical protein [Azoarcus sp.]
MSSGESKAKPSLYTEFGLTGVVMSAGSLAILVAIAVWGISTTTTDNKQIDTPSADTVKEAPVEPAPKIVEVMDGVHVDVEKKHKTFPITVKDFVRSYNKRLRASGLASFTIKAPETIRGDFFDTFGVPPPPFVTNVLKKAGGIVGAVDKKTGKIIRISVTFGISDSQNAESVAQAMLAMLSASAQVLNPKVANSVGNPLEKMANTLVAEFAEKGGDAGPIKTKHGRCIYTASLTRASGFVFEIDPI